MQSGVWHAAGGPRALSLARWSVLAIALASGGCVTTGQQAAGPAGTVSFEAIDGPPAPVFRKLVNRLNDEAQVRRVAVVSRDAPAQYRIRGYVSALVHGKNKRNSIAWVWDVYDSQERRAVRLTGEEEAGPYRQDAWSSADDQVLGRIAQNGMQQLAAFLDTPDAAPPAAAPEPSDPSELVADAGPVAGTAEARTLVAMADIPVPRKRPETTRGLTAADLLTYAQNRR